MANRGWESGVDKSNITTAADLNLRRDEIHEARELCPLRFHKTPLYRFKKTKRNMGQTKTLGGRPP